MNKEINLQNKVQEYEKSNEKVHNDAKANFESKIKKVDKEAKEQVEQTEVKVSELHENLDKMQDVGKEKLKYDLELMAWQQDCASLEKTIQEEKYRIQIEQARMKQEMEAQFEESLEQFQAQATQDA